MPDWDTRELEGRDGDPYIITEDGAHVYNGDPVYNYYDMWPGTIVLSDEQEDKLASPMVPRRVRMVGTWFYVRPIEPGQQTLLNGARICSMSFAKAKGWPGA